MDIFAAVLQMVVLHRIDGMQVSINPSHVVSLHASMSGIGRPNKLIIEQAQCALIMSDGKLISVVETCDRVKQLLEEATR